MPPSTRRKNRSSHARSEAIKAVRKQKGEEEELEEHEEYEDEVIDLVDEDELDRDTSQDTTTHQSLVTGSNNNNKTSVRYNYHHNKKAMNPGSKESPSSFSAATAAGMAATMEEQLQVMVSEMLTPSSASQTPPPPTTSTNTLSSSPTTTTNTATRFKLNHQSVKQEEYCCQQHEREESALVQHRQELIRNSNNNGDEDVEDDDGCLHCHQYSTEYKVRCEECHSYICEGCHWCHEYQANHEIRVCDRCDAFYCRNCDEMDQCDDCGEVVCASCSTLLSCKFCGGGLCEECATACGRCGIVLCSRDAKFAVDCDTCRLSYCLVCLASGSKDACVRCGHRPSKRMEQLVHLRLKSIYKAFKQSSRSPKNAMPTAALDSTTTPTLPPNQSTCHPCNPSEATLPPNSNSLRNHYPSHSNANHNQYYSHLTSRHRFGDTGPTIEELEDGMDDDEDVDEDMNHRRLHANSYATASAAAAAAAGMHHPFLVDKDIAHSKKKNNPLLAAAARLTHDLMTKHTMEEKQKEADAAAEALLAELDEEEEAAKSKKSKKKRKKEKKAAAAAKHRDQDTPVLVEEDRKGDEIGEDPPKSKKGDLKEAEPKSIESSSAQKGAFVPVETRSSEEKAAPIQIKSENKKSAKASNQVPSAQQSDSMEMATPDATAPKHGTTESSPGTSIAEKNDAPEQPHAIDPIEKRLCGLVEDCDIDGIEGILFELKGVPGRAALRKNAKKALKRLKTPMAEPNDAGVQVSAETEAPLAQAPPPRSEEHQNTPPTDQTAPMELLKIVSDNTVPGKQPNRVECVMQMSPIVVGWVIGKGGQRIRDLMEETGAKVWIDQEKARPEELRNVFISGERRSVDQAVRMVHSIVSKAPVEGASKYDPETTPLSPTAQKVTETTQGHERTGVAAGTVPSDVRETLRPAQLVQPPPAGSQAAQPPALPKVHRIESADDNDRVEHVMTCEARFVPLLIGKRGWAVKDIQDKSGARVDIDQSVTPRQIRISGLKECVRKAIPMVRDVLNYPHAQPQPPAPHPENDQELLGVAAALQSYAVCNSAVQTDDRPQSPPPSSYIMTGDAKSMISACSSLSSTPEPSMASSHTKAFLAPGPFLQTSDYGVNNNNNLANHQMPLPPRSSLMTPELPTSLPRSGDRGVFLPRPSPQGQGMYGGNGLMGLQHIPGMTPPHPYHNPEQMYQQPPKSSVLPMGHNMIHSHPGPGSFGGNNLMATGTSQLGGPNFGVMGPPHSSTSAPIGLPQQAMNTPVQVSGYNGIPNASLPPLMAGSIGQDDMGFGGQVHGGVHARGGVGLWDNNNNNAGSNNVIPPGMPPPAPVHSNTSTVHSPSPGLGATVPIHLPPVGTDKHFLETLRNKPSEVLDASIGMSPNPPLSLDVGGVGTGFDRGQSLDLNKPPFGVGFEASSKYDTRQDDARIIDSLFGPPSTSDLGVDPAQSLLPSLDGLSLGGGGGGGEGLAGGAGIASGSGGAGLWGSSLTNWNTGSAPQTTSVTVDNNRKDPSMGTSLLVGLQPFQVNQDNQHPPQSRFNWGSANA